MRRAAIALALLALATLPLWMGSNYYVNVASQIMIWAIFALGLNILVGYGGLVSLGHAGLFGMASYTAAWLLSIGAGQLAAGTAAIVLALAAAAVFAVLALRATGISFLMITLALGQILWGVAYRWISLTGGDNGINVSGRPAPFGISLSGATPFYYLTLIVLLATVAVVHIFVGSPLGVCLQGTRDQPRRMTALGFNVWLIRFLAFLVSGLLAGVSGLLFVYYNQFVSPHVLSLTTSAEVLLMVIAGGSATLIGPIIGAALVVIVQYVVSAYIERWNLVLGAIFVAIILFMPEGLVPGSVRLWQRARRLMDANLAQPRLGAKGGAP
jgi:branched-chain amino acid transport system permease protein